MLVFFYDEGGNVCVKYHIKMKNNGFNTTAVTLKSNLDITFIKQYSKLTELTMYNIFKQQSFLHASIFEEELKFHYVIH